jgi:hypothetical protein
MWSTLIPLKMSNTVLAGMFVLGIGTGVTLDSAINTNPKVCSLLVGVPHFLKFTVVQCLIFSFPCWLRQDLASRDAIDRAAPNAELCQQYGSSAMVMDQRLFVSFNPFNVYVSQADTKPGCVLRQSTVVPVLADRGLLDKNEIANCKNNMNTWAFVGDLDDRPQLSCVYRSQDAQNEFLSNPTIGLGEDVYDDGTPRLRNAGNLPETAKRIKEAR